MWGGNKKVGMYTQKDVKRCTVLIFVVVLYLHLTWTGGNWFWGCHGTVSIGLETKRKWAWALVGCWVGKLLFLFLLPHFFLCCLQRIKMDSHDIVKGLVKFFYVFGSDPSTYFLFARLCTDQNTRRAIFVLFHRFSGSFWCVPFHGHIDSAFLFRTGIQFRQRHWKISVWDPHCVCHLLRGDRGTVIIWWIQVGL